MTEPPDEMVTTTPAGSAGNGRPAAAGVPEAVPATPSAAEAEPATAKPEPQTGVERALSELWVAWGAELQAVVCERCDWSFLVLPNVLNSSERRCPHCFQAELTRMETGVQELPYIRPPELALPFSLSNESLTLAIESFSRGIPFAPQDLNPQALRSRVRQVWVPLWLVDAQVSATWQAEAGFDYQVVSHQEHYQSGWQTREVTEGRVRWEPRLGKLTRQYNNLTAPALEEHRQLEQILGMDSPAKALAYTVQALPHTFVRLPNRPPKDAWPEATANLQQAAAEECRQAAGANHWRSFRWQPQFTNQNWTLMLTPALTTYYLDDDGRPQVVMLDGQTGKISGQRRSSMKRAQWIASMILLVAAGLFVVSLLASIAGLLFPPALIVGVIGLGLALVVAFGAIVPLYQAWQFNKGT